MANDPVDMGRASPSAFFRRELISEIIAQQLDSKCKVIWGIHQLSFEAVRFRLRQVGSGGSGLDRDCSFSLAAPLCSFDSMKPHEERSPSSVEVVRSQGGAAAWPSWGHPP